MKIVVNGTEKTQASVGQMASWYDLVVMALDKQPTVTVAMAQVGKEPTDDEYMPFRPGQAKGGSAGMVLHAKVDFGDVKQRI